MHAPPPLASATPHERVRKLLLNHLKVIERAAQDQEDPGLRQACADYAKAVAQIPVETAR